MMKRIEAYRFKSIYKRDILIAFDRYSICAPKLFNDLAAKDPKKCANDALLLVGMDKDHFRTGHTKVGNAQLYFVECI